MNFKTTLDTMFAKIFPAAAQAAEEDHEGGFNLGDLVVILLDLVLLIYTAYRSWHFLSGSVADDFQILAIVGLWGLDIGMVAWSLVWIFGSTTKFQNWTSLSLFVIDMIGVFLTSIVDTLAYGGGSNTLPPIMQTAAWYGIPIIIGLNVLAGFIYHMTSPATRKRRAVRAQDEEMSQQRERGELEIRRMNMQLQQAQDYTAKRATMLVAFADISEQNIAMKQIEDAMMARLNQSASGQLNDLLNATGLHMPGVPAPQPHKQSRILEQINALKAKFGADTTTSTDHQDQQSPQPQLVPDPITNNFGSNGHKGDSNQSP